MSAGICARARRPTSMVARRCAHSRGYPRHAWTQTWERTENSRTSAAGSEKHPHMTIYSASRPYVPVYRMKIALI